MRGVDLHPEQLFDALRAGKLSAAERARLEAHCIHCSACTFELRWLESSPVAPEPSAEDRAYGEAAFDNLLRASGARRVQAPKRSLGWPVRLAAAGLLLACVAGAALLLTRTSRVEPPPAVPAVVSRAPEPSEATSSVPPPTKSQVEPRADADVAPTQPSANQLLAAARRAQTRGQIDRAERLYRQVIELYPSTTAAGAGQVALGRLLYELRSQPSAALATFDSYLQRRPNGSLAEEALFYRAMALERLGHNREAAASLRELLETFPNSLYAAPARVRLAHERKP